MAIACIGRAQSPAGPSEATLRELQARPDVTIYVYPVSTDAARVTIGFAKRIPHKTVKQDIERLTENGWRVDPSIRLSDRSIQADGRVTTAGQFVLRNAPQVVDNAPQLMPYIRAFQDLHHISIAFAVSGLKPYNGAEYSENSDFIIRHVPDDSMYQYDVLVRNHSGKMIAAVPAGESRPQISPGHAAEHREHEASSSSLPIMLVISALGLGAGMLVVNWVVRRGDRANASPRDMRR